MPMFEPTDTPRVYGLAPGVDFPQELLNGLLDRLKSQPPHAIAQIDLIVNTRRMQRRLRELFDTGPASLLPRIHLIDNLDTLSSGVALPRPSPALRRRLELITLVSKLLDQAPDLAPRASLYDLSDSLAGLMDEMQGEGVSVEAITNLDVSDQSGHWERAKQFLDIAHRYLGEGITRPDPRARQRQVAAQLIASWKKTPPQHPVIVAGSTGSRGTSAMLMHAVSRLPQGAVILPGYDFDMPGSVWTDLGEDQEKLSQDHPQYRFRDMLRTLEMSHRKVTAWTDKQPPSPERNALVSLSLRPAPVTHVWLTEGPKLPDLAAATKGLTLIQAPTPRAEAIAIAMRLRQAVEDGQTAALITPDRMLSRQVTSALDRWNILPDDSAGSPLHLSPPGRFLRHIADLFLRKLDSEALLTILKHPLTHSGGDRNLHQLNTQRLELQLRRDGLPYPDAQGILRLARKSVARSKQPDQMDAWATWVGESFTDLEGPDDLSLETWVTQHLNQAKVIADGSNPTSESRLWQQTAGEEADKVMTDLAENAQYGGDMSASDYAELLSALLQNGEVRERDAPHPHVMIWGTMEARVQGADLIIMGGLNDSTWPEAPPPDPWLNRQMRLKAGLLLPERRIGLSAHDYQQSIAAPEVCLTRAIRSDEAETVPSRWLNRLGNLLNGLPEQGGKAAWTAMIKRGDHWLEQARALEAVTRVPPATRPSPRPPRAARPHALSVTEIKRLIRDPYAVYAKHSLKLRALNPLVQSPDAPVRGIIVHEIMEKFIKSVSANPATLTKAHLLETAAQVLEAEAPWPAARVMWLTKIERIADWFVENEIKRQSYSSPAAFEKAAKGSHSFADLGFTLTGFADRIDRTDDGDILIYDYKTGAPPSKSEQKAFDKQLLLEAAMVEEGGFKQIRAAHVANAAYIGLGSNPVELSAPLEEEPPHEVLAKLHALMTNYLSDDQGFTSRRMVKTTDFAGDYDQLARFGEWDGTNDPVPEDLT
jgi:ATP-dependent helicase/nuclease subunit B